MYKRQVVEINQDLKRTKKAVIALGCSFTQGQGAVDDELYDCYNWKYTKEGEPLLPDVSKKERIAILNNYPDVTKSFSGDLDFTFLEYKNSYVNVLCKKYLHGEYTPINLGMRGCGNRGTIKELYLHPEILWNYAEEIIVIFSPSGLERFDFINDTCIDHHRWIAMWPHYESMEKDTARRSLWEGYSKCIWSEKNEIIEQICHVQELMSWCKNKNAKLIITPAFDRKYNKEYFRHMLSQEITRDNTVHELKASFLNKHPDCNLVNLYPWDNFFYPDGHRTFADLALANDHGVDDKTDYYNQFLGKRSPHGWITPCAHPGQKAHDLFAKLLADHIKF